MHSPPPYRCRFLYITFLLLGIKFPLNNTYFVFVHIWTQNYETIPFTSPWMIPVAFKPTSIIVISVETKKKVVIFVFSVKEWHGKPLNFGCFCYLQDWTVAKNKLYYYHTADIKRGWNMHLVLLRAGVGKSINHGKPTGNKKGAVPMFPSSLCHSPFNSRAEWGPK